MATKYIGHCTQGPSMALGGPHLYLMCTCTCIDISLVTILTGDMFEKEDICGHQI